MTQAIIPSRLRPIGAVLFLLLCAAMPARANGQVVAVNPDSLEYWLGPDDDVPEPLQWRLSTGLDFSAGDYGLDEPSESWQQSVNLTAARGRWTLGVSTSYQRFSGPALDLDIFEDAVAFEDALFTGDIFTRRTVKGFGDTSVALRYDMTDALTSGWLTSAALKVKLPTADRSAGLGSGHTDVTLGADTVRLLGRWSVFGSGAYTLRGESAADPRRDTWSASLGADYRLDRLWRVGVALDHRTLSRPDGGGTSDIYAFARLRLNDRLALTGYGLAGLDRNSPDLSVGLRLSWRFTQP
ncbi:MAG: transporter [Rhodospirillaceae bacterium]|nr:transporter [Rhodospirillaceae bacterium]